MTIEKMRTLVQEAYGGPLWKAKVEGMNDRQVCAIYHRLCEDGAFNRKGRKTNAIGFMEEDYGVQMTIWDYMKMKEKQE